MGLSVGFSASPDMLPPPQNNSGGPAQDFAETSKDNPSPVDPQSLYFTLNDVTPEDQKMLVETITEYRSGWAQDRLERFRQWMQNVFYWKGVQVIRWDTATNCWYDALAWARSQDNDNGEDTDLERWINPLTLMFCNVFTGTMSRAVPKTIIKPRNSDPSLKDTVTAKAAVEAIRIIEQKNRMRKMVRSMFEMLYLFGSYFRYTRASIDGNMFGYDEQVEFTDMEIESEPHYTCPKCGMETPATSPDGMECPNCGAFMGQESYYGAGEGNRTSLKSLGVKRVPRAGVKWTLHSPIEIDADPKAKGDDALTKTPILAKDCEIDLGEARQMFPQLYTQIQAGAETSTTPNASAEKLARTDAISAIGGMAADNALSNPTYSEVWVTPMAYNKKGDPAFAQRMKAKFPDGLKVAMVGELVVDIREAVLVKEWSHCALYANQGIYCSALANTAVSFNARFNRVMWILDDWASRAALGLNFADAARIDTEKMSGKAVPAGTLTPVPMRINGEPRPMTELLAHFDLPINPALWGYPMMLMTFCEIIIGIPRQLSGQGTQDDVETLGGQQLQLARAATTLKPYWENVQDEHAAASQNAIECLQLLMKTGAVTKIWDVIEERGGAFQNKEVDWESMQGEVEFSIDEDQNLPVSPDEIRTAIETMYASIEKGNPLAVEWFSVPANQDLALSTMLPGSVLPDEAQRLKTECDIQTIIEQGPEVTMNPDGSQGTQLPVHPTKAENFPVAKAVTQRYMLEHFTLRVENPQAWIMLNQYYDELDDMDMKVAQQASARQLAVTQAGQPKPPAPDPGMMAAVQELQKLAVAMSDQLARLATIDPMLTKGTITGQKDAAGKVVDAAIDATKAVMGGK